MTSETMEYYLSNDTILAPFEPVYKNYMTVYLNVDCLYDNTKTQLKLLFLVAS